MCRLRPLRITLGIAGFAMQLWLVLPTFAADRQVEARITDFSSSGTPVVNLTSAAPQVGSLSAETSVRSPVLPGENLILSASVTQSKNDYHSTLLMNAEGDSSPLSDRFHGMETSGNVGAEWRAGANSTRLSYGQMLGAGSPYPFLSTSLGESYSFFEGATTAGADWNWNRQKQPLNFFTDPRDFHLKARPEILRSEEFALWMEQILSARWKAQLRVLGGERLEDRPPHLGGEIRSAHSLTERLSLRVDAGALRELRNQALKDERGYFGVYWLEMQASYELIYDLLLKAAAGTTVEREDVPWNGKRTQVGTDTLGLSAAYQGRRWNASLGGLVSFSNTSYRSRTVEGTFAWEL
jgi:hypothetical protein